MGGNLVDLTGDGIKEYIYRDTGDIFIYGCSNGKYSILQQEPGGVIAPNIEFIKDLNKNGLPEVYLSNYWRNWIFSLKIIEWNGEEFTPLIDIKGDNSTVDELIISGWNISTTDKNNDTFKEIVVIDSVHYDPDDYALGLPWRASEITLGWNGKKFIIKNKDFFPPEYRFQAVQDGDRAAGNFEFNKAIAYYQDAIFSDKLDWWSYGRREYEYNLIYNSWFAKLEAQIGDPTSTPLPTEMYPVEDTSEYYRLAAYAYFRMIVIHVLRNEMDAAQIKHVTMQKKFLPDSPGYPYLEMATAFMNTFQQSQNMTDACGAAIDYATRNPDILTPLGSDYHGAQSLIYTPKDVCPFR
jgi:hypothetical protein